MSDTSFRTCQVLRGDLRAIVATALGILVMLAASPGRADALEGSWADAASPAPTAPVLKTRAEAVYPPEALRDGIDGTVGLELVVDERGDVESARITLQAGHGFDAAAVEAARKFTFEPARLAGKPIRSVLQLAYDFRLPRSERGDAPAAPAATVTPPVAAPAAAPQTALADVQTGADQSTIVLARKPLGASVQEPDPIAASDARTDQNELSLRPRLRAENVLEAVPGLFTVQHAGGGKSQQYFTRGFDLDHGTDLAFLVDGVPVNAVSHAHGQGYSDLHFLIPETIEALESTKGPYSARVGDFATAGSVTFHMADHVAESSVGVELGPDGHRRVVVLESPDLGTQWRALAAVEAFDEDGPFIHPESFDRFNAYTKATRVFDDRSQVSLLLMGYGGTWNMSGVLPARAVCGEGDGTPVPPAYAGSRCLSRWESADPSQGGAAQRAMALATFGRPIHGGDVEAEAFALRSNLQLFPNDGIASSLQPAGLRYGSQIEQDDRRTETGATVRLSKRLDLGGTEVRATGGLSLRNDGIDVQLHRTKQRQRLDGKPGIPGPIVDASIDETELGAYAEVDWRPAKWLRFVLGAREDRVDATVTNESDAAVEPVSGVTGQSQLSPKAAAVVSPLEGWDVFANYGRGFHSNDARTLVEGTATTLLAIATGYEVGTTVRPADGLSLSAVGFLLDLSSELTLDGDTASIRPSGATRRYGGEFSARYQVRDRVYFAVTFTAAHARYTDAADVAARDALVPLAPVRTFSAGVGVREPIGPFTVVGSVYIRSMSDRPATQDGSLTATGSTVVNAEAGLRWRHVELDVDLLNLTNVTWREGQFAVNARLPGEGPNPPEGISFTPGIPRTLLARATAFW